VVLGASEESFFMNFPKKRTYMLINEDPIVGKYPVESTLIILKNKPDENKAVKWIKITDLYEHTKTDKGMFDIYMKSIRKAEKLL